jgi:hypothetical protein
MTDMVVMNVALQIVARGQEGQVRLMQLGFAVPALFYSKMERYQPT